MPEALRTKKTLDWAMNEGFKYVELSMYYLHMLGFIYIV